ncbi:MAG: hypothetical protein OXC72_01880 [Roseovarius sp.]|nr:hypothetical protein [Roseovarius sp.]
MSKKQCRIIASIIAAKLRLFVYRPVADGWIGFTGLRHDGEFVIRTGMTSRRMSWFAETGRENHFVSNTVLLVDCGPEMLNAAKLRPHLA